MKNKKFVFKRISDENPYFPEEVIIHKDNLLSYPKTLVLDENDNLMWQTIESKEDSCYSINDDGALYIKENRIGIGRYPLHKYKLDIALSENKVETGIHIGDGIYGFSMGNGSSNGFIPQIIGMSMKEDEPGLYFIGRTGDYDNNIKSNVPIITFDCRNNINTNNINRPLFGIKLNGKKECEMLLDENGILHVKDISINGVMLSSILKK